MKEVLGLNIFLKNEAKESMMFPKGLRNILDIFPVKGDRYNFYNGFRILNKQGEKG